MQHWIFIQNLNQCVGACHLTWYETIYKLQRVVDKSITIIMTTTVNEVDAIYKKIEYYHSV